jgi:hypothetical protein
VQREWGQPMRVGLWGLLIVLPLAGCLEIGAPTPQVQAIWDRTPGLGEKDMTKEQKTAKDDGICRGYGAQPGTPAYIQCRATQDQRRDAVLLSDSGAPAPVVNAAPANYGPRPGDPPVLQNILPPTTNAARIRELGERGRRATRSDLTAILILCKKMVLPVIRDV